MIPQEGANSVFPATRPCVVFIPTTPQNDAGIRTLPPPSEPTPIGTRPAPTALPVPAELPPVQVLVSYGFRAVGKLALIPVTPNPISCMLVLPKMIQPASRSLCTAGASSLAGLSFSVNRLPNPVTKPLTSVSSFTTAGTPSKMPSGVPLMKRSVESAAACSTSSLRTLNTAFSGGFSLLDFSIRDRMCSATCEGVIDLVL
mmetsp:Transcript_22421/g.37051  ORF Transcript_22421/g.37051 Transcript_22421/m.37051 type:complete len:201 (-) Transcript_22421:17-619(-)